jgi:hypothetical protein
MVNEADPTKASVPPLPERLQPWLAGMWLAVAPAAGAIALNSILWLWWSALPLLGLMLHVAQGQRRLTTDLASQPPGSAWQIAWHPVWYFAFAAWALMTASVFWSPDPAIAAGKWWQWTVACVGCWWFYQVRHSIQSSVLWMLVVIGLFQAYLGILQEWIVFPTLIAGIESANTSQAPNALVDRFGAHAVLERLRNGGVYGTLLLANLYALFCGIGLLICLAAARINKWCLIPAAVLAWAMFLSGAKGATAAVVAGALLAWSAQAWRRRWWVPIILVGVAGIFLSVSAGLRLSMAVRLDYWLAALNLIGDRPLTGFGIDGFRYHNWAYLPMHAEWSRFPHNTWLMLAVTAGITLPLLVGGGIAVVVRKLSLGHNAHQHSDTKSHHQAAPSIILPLSSGILCLGVTFLLGGYTSDNLSLLSQSTLGQILLGLLGAALATGLSWPLRHVCSTKRFQSTMVATVLSATWFAWILAASIDFPHQTTGLLTVLAAVTALLVPRSIVTQKTTQKTIIYGQLVTLLMMVFCGQFSAQRARNLDSVDVFLTASQQEKRAALLGDMHPQDPRAQHVIDAKLSAFLETTRDWPMSRGHHLTLINYFPAPQRRLQELNQFPWETNYKWWTTKAKAQAHLQAMPFLLEAIASQEKAISLAPHLMPLRRVLLSYYEQALRTSNQEEQRQELLTRQQRVLSDLEALRFGVHPRHQ